MTTQKIIEVDPKVLVIAANIRTNTKLSKEFVASIKLHGVKVPIEAHEVEGGYEVLDGQRRTLAAVEAKLAAVPVRVTKAGSDVAERIVDQLVMNDQREQLTRGERVRAVQELALIGIPAGDIAKRTSTPKDSIDKAIAVAASEVASKAIEEHEITLDQAAALVEFEDDKTITADLIARAKSGRDFDYAVKEARKKRNLAASKKELSAKLKAAGVPKVNEGAYYSYGDGPGKQLSDLVDAKGKDITEAAHRKCPGHAAYVYSGYYAEEASLVYVCTDWEANGHTKKRNGYVETPEERERREERERKAAERQQAEELSAELRGEFIIGLLQRDVSKLEGAVGVVAEVIAGYTSTLVNRYYSGDNYRAIALRWLGVTVPEGVRTERALAEALERPSAKPLVVALATSLALQESYVDAFNVPAVQVGYLGTLERWGHKLTEHERSMVETATAALAEDAEREAKRVADAAAASEESTAA